MLLSAHIVPWVKKKKKKLESAMNYSVTFCNVNFAQMYRTCGVHSKLTYSQIVLDKSLFLFFSWFSNASLLFVLSHKNTKNLLSHLKRLRLQNSWS